MRNREPSVVERRACPGRSGMASLASGRESRGHMVRIRGALIIALMTRVTIRGGGGIVAPDMTTGAWSIYVRPGKREPSGAMVKSGGGPGARIVADLALLGNAGRRMVRVRRAVVLSQVAGDTGRAEPNVFPPHMAGRAGHLEMRSG